MSYLLQRCPRILANHLYKPFQGFYIQSSTNTGNTAAETKAETTEKTESRWSKWTGKNAYKLGLLMIGLMGASGFSVLVYRWGPPEVDEEGREVMDEFSEMAAPVAYTARTWKHILDFNKSIRDPVSDNLLPDPVQPPYYQPPYTLVMEMKSVLVHPEWTWKSGWRFKKRPALELFLQQVAPFYEVVVFTDEIAMSAAPVLQQMDPNHQYIHYHLFREATRYKNGCHIKDLSCLNRDLSKVIYLDSDEKASQMQPRNALHLESWEGDEKDRELIDLAAFLRMVAMSEITDVREVLEQYNSTGRPLDEFRRRHQQLIEDQMKRKEDQKKKSSSNQNKFGFKGMTRL